MSVPVIIVGGPHSGQSYKLNWPLRESLFLEDGSIGHRYDLCCLQGSKDNYYVYAKPGVDIIEELIRNFKPKKLE
jgi:hypothetical protein